MTTPSQEYIDEYTNGIGQLGPEHIVSAKLQLRIAAEDAEMIRQRIARLQTQLTTTEWRREFWERNVGAIEREMRERGIES